MLCYILQQCYVISYVICYDTCCVIYYASLCYIVLYYTVLRYIVLFYTISYIYTIIYTSFVAHAFSQLDPATVEALVARSGNLGPVQGWRHHPQHLPLAEVGVC